MAKQAMLRVACLFLVLSSTALAQSCIRREVLAALEELPAVTLSGNQTAYSTIAEIEELNNTMREGFRDIKLKIQSFQKSLKEELEENHLQVTKEIDEIKDELQKIQQLLQTSLSLHFTPGLSHSNPALSCKAIHNNNTSTPSGYYWLQSSSEQVTRAYCDMNRTTCGDSEGGWMKVASIDMTNSNSVCPSGLQTLTSPKRLCAKNANGGGCSSAYLNVHGVFYSQVCGKIIGYQDKTPDAFGAYYNNRALTIDDGYVDGISLTHGLNPRKHIWTFAAALQETLHRYPQYLCPCTNIHNHVTVPIPPFIDNDYFCDTGSSQNYEFRFYSNDPLWDGEGCGTLNTCCSFNGPPWFTTQLPASTNENIEIRLCSDESRTNEDINFEELELYVK